MQWWICDNILCNVRVNDVAHGFVKRRSYISNANVHFGANHILNIDIKEFFNNIKTIDIFNVFLSLGYGNEASLILTSLCSFNKCAPTSPMIANILLRELDSAISTLCLSKNIKYTRYADDLTFSCSEKIDDVFLDEINSIISNNGFQLNPSKTRFMGRGDRMDVTGLVVNTKVWMSRQWRNKARGYLHRVIMNPDGYINDYNKVAGMFACLKQFDPNVEKK